MTGTGFIEPVTVNGGCAAGTVQIVSSKQIRCTLDDYALQTVVDVSVTAQSTTSSTLHISTQSNALMSAPETFRLSLTSISVQLSVEKNGVVYMIAVPSGTAVAYTDVKLQYETASALCAAKVNVGSMFPNTLNLDCASSLGSVGTVDVYVVAEGSAPDWDIYGEMSSVVSTSMCHSDCATCNGDTAADCTSCRADNTYDPQFTTHGYCCDGSCGSCAIAADSDSAQAPTSCTTCNAGYRPSPDLSSTLCCHRSCLTCFNPTTTGCLTCPGRSEFDPTTNMCNGGQLEIHGDPHFFGFLNQEYTITGSPDQVYSVITCPNLQMNVRFISYGDIYNGTDPTTIPPSPYQCNVTYIGEIGIKLWNEEKQHEDRIYVNIKKFTVQLNGKDLKKDQLYEFGQNCTISTNKKKIIEIYSPRLTWKFIKGGTKEKPFWNEQIQVNDWHEFTCHGLLGQSWKKTQSNVDKNAIYRDHEPGYDFFFKNTAFLEGRLFQYQIKENQVFADQSMYNQYKH